MTDTPMMYGAMELSAWIERLTNGNLIAKGLPVRRKTPMEIGKIERAARRAAAAADHE